MKKLMVAVVLTLLTLFNFQTEARSRTHKKHSHSRVHNRKKHKPYRKKVREKSIAKKASRKNRCPKFARTNPKAVHDIVLDMSAKHQVPAEIVLAVMYYETGYRGVDHKSYNGRRVSSCGAVGPMQVMPRYAGKVLGRKVTRNELLTNYKTNIEVGVKMLARHRKRYGSWLRALGAYSTGKPRANKYGRKILHKANQIEEQMLIAGTNC
jgi:soluble lytic murein transglycosylase-like protein